MHAGKNEKYEQIKTMEEKCGNTQTILRDGKKRKKY